MLHYNRNVRNNYAGIISIPGYRCWGAQIVEPNVPCSPCRHNDLVRTHGVFIRKVNGDLNVGVSLTGVKNTNGFMAGELWLGAIAPPRNIAFGNCPYLLSYFHNDFFSLIIHLFQSQLNNFCEMQGINICLLLYLLPTAKTVSNNERVSFCIAYCG